MIYYKKWVNKKQIGKYDILIIENNIYYNIILNI